MPKTLICRCQIRTRPPRNWPLGQALEEEKQALERARHQVSDQIAELPRKLDELQVGQVSELLLEQARLDAQAAQLRQEYLQLEIANSEQRIRELK